MNNQQFHFRHKIQLLYLSSKNVGAKRRQCFPSESDPIDGDEFPILRHLQIIKTVEHPRNLAL